MEGNIDNTPEEPKKEEASSTNLNTNFRDFITSLYHFVRQTLSFTDEVDKEATIKVIKGEIDFKGFNIWILIFSIIIASIGLNTDSTAVIIGAMLISPLMGPIMGMGLSLGTNDWSTLVRSFKSFVITVGVSLVTSTLYFSISPFGEAGEEILSRTHPELRDVFIAIFGGLAGIMASSRNKISNVIPGVAIATALMPPLCTAGYGIATLNLQFFLGAFYLFVINSVYIALTSFVVIKYLKFPLVHFLDEIKEKKFKKYILVFSILLIIPSIWTLVKSYQKNDFEANAKEYIEFYFDVEDLRHTTIDYDGGEKPKIEILLYDKRKDSEGSYEMGLTNFGMDTSDVQLDIKEDTKYADLVKRLDETKLEQITFSEDNYIARVNQIRDLNTEKDSLNLVIESMISDTIPFSQISKELKALFKEVDQFEYGIYKVTDFKSVKEEPTFHIKWKRKLRSNKLKEEKLKNWLKERLKLSSVRVISY
tara:strand:+ start:743 stop:2179 length:1437 start_codon:yes stop_codon:yes gene_type:complete